MVEEPQAPLFSALWGSQWLQLKDIQLSLLCLEQCSHLEHQGHIVPGAAACSTFLPLKTGKSAPWQWLIRNLNMKPQWGETPVSVQQVADSTNTAFLILFLNFNFPIYRPPFVFAWSAHDQAPFLPRFWHLQNAPCLRLMSSCSSLP